MTRFARRDRVRIVAGSRIDRVPVRIAPVAADPYTGDMAGAMAAAPGGARRTGKPFVRNWGARIAALLIGAVAVGALGWGWYVFLRFGGPQEGYEITFTLIALAIIGMGWLIASRVPGNPIGPLVCAFGLSIACLVARDAWLWGSFLLPDMLPQPSPLVLALLGGFGTISFVLIVMIVVLFPTGRMPSARWRILLWTVPAVWILFEVAQIWYPAAPFAPYQDEPSFASGAGVIQQALAIAATVLLLLTLLVSLIAALVRVRRADGVLKAQLKWVLLGACLFLFYPFVCGTEVLLFGEPTWPSLVLAMFATASLPVGVAIGMLRHDLFDVDRALAATVTWAIVATAIGLAFAAVIAVGGALAGAGSPMIAAIATAVGAIAIAPLHRAVNRRIGARLYPQRRAGLQAIRALEASVNAGAGNPTTLAVVLAAALHDPAVALAYTVPGTDEIVDAAGAPATAAGTAIEAGGERIGILAAPSISESLRRELGAASVGLIMAVRLHVHLSRSLAEVEASRGRIVAAEDNARRRFERDLHDGAQQRLVSLGMALRHAQRHLAMPHAEADVDIDAVLEAAVAEIGTAVAELRRLAHGIRPSVLDDGLGPALASLVRIVPVPVTLDVDALAETDPIPERVATTAYFVAAEALANAVKHAEAESISVSVTRAHGDLRIAVHDDGRGSADVNGAGLRGLEDRVAALGGRVLLASMPGHGTTVQAELPCAS